jgi:hypothetical protein
VFNQWLKSPLNPLNSRAKLKKSYFLAGKSAVYVSGVSAVSTVFDT